MKKKILIQGMKCGHCISHVAEALSDIGASNIVVNLEEKSATVDVGEEVTDDTIKSAIEDSGYDVVGIEGALIL